MYMRNYIIISVLLLMVACSKHEGYTIVGSVPEAWEGKSVYLTAADVNEPYYIDSTVVSDGAFKFVGELKNPQYCNLVIYLDDEDRITRSKIITASFFVENSSISVTYDGSSRDAAFVVTGSATNDEYNKVSEMVKAVDDERRKVFSAYTASYYRGEELDKSISLIKEHTAKQEEIMAIKIDYIKEHPASVLSVKLAQELIDRNSTVSQDVIEDLYETLSTELKNTESARSLKQSIDNRNIYIGAPYLDYELETADGKKKNISDFIEPGTTTLLEFWASWCAPCIEEMPFIKRTYAKYHSKGFNVLSISIDADKQSWLNAMEKESMPWGQLLDQNSEAFRMYNLTGVPSSLLIDEDGKIILLNARGGWLDAAMQEKYDN